MRPHRTQISQPRSHARTTRLILFATGATFLTQLAFLRAWPSPAGPGPDPFTALFALHPSGVLGQARWWQLLTFAFLHDPDTAWHVLINLLAVGLLGTSMERTLGPRRVLILYFGSVLTAGLASALLVPSSAAIGSAGAVYGLLVAYAVFRWNSVPSVAFLSLKSQHLALLGGAAVAAYNLNRPGHSLADVAQLAGLAFGLLFAAYEPRVTALLRTLESRRRAHEAQQAAQTRQRVDDLLDKINREGMAQLTRRERAFLRRASKLYRNGRIGE